MDMVIPPLKRRLIRPCNMQPGLADEAHHGPAHVHPIAIGQPRDQAIELPAMFRGVGQDNPGQSLIYISGELNRLVR